MKKLLIILFLVCSSSLFSQQIIQTYTDRCTGAVYTFTVAYNSSTVVTFYNKSRVFTSAEFTNGTLKAWLEETYQWWKNLSPCSANQSNTTSTQTTTTTTTTNSTNAANNATNNTSSSSSTTNTSSTNTSSGSSSSGNTGSDTGSSSSSSGSSSGGDTGSSGSSGSDSGGSSGGDSGSGSGDSGSGDNGSGDSGSGDNGSGDSGSGDSGSGDGGDGDSGSGDGDNSGGDGDGSGGDEGNGDGDGDGDGESSSEEKKEESKEEESKEEESKEEEKKEEDENKEEDKEESDEESEEEQEEESEEEESEEEDSEDDEEEDSEEESDNEDEEEEDEEREKRLAPPIISANLMTMQMIDGTISTAASFGISQSSLTGVNTYSLNTMVWSNLQQFMIGASVSTVYFNYDKEVPVLLDDPFTGGKINIGTYYDKGTISSVDSNAVNFMYMFGTTMISYSYSKVFMGQKDNFWKGFVGGYAASTGVIRSFGQTLSSNSLTGFGTKPFTFEKLPRWSFSPMVAISIPIKIQPLDLKFIPAKNFTYIVGNSTNFQLTQRFVANLGINVIGNTDPIIPLTFAATIGARFAF